MLAKSRWLPVSRSIMMHLRSTPRIERFRPQIVERFPEASAGGATCRLSAVAGARGLGRQGCGDVEVVFVLGAALTDRLRGCARSCRSTRCQAGVVPAAMMRRSTDRN